MADYDSCKKKLLIYLWLGQVFFGVPLLAAPFGDSGFEQKWLRALHYQSTWSGYESRIDDDRFFIDPFGKWSPQQELATTIRLAHQDPNYLGEPIKCLLPYRYRILRDANKIPPDQRPCPKLDFFKKDVGSYRVSMGFISQYPDNPASIMGHSFLMFTNPQKRVGKAPIPYLYKTVGYAARVPKTTNALEYVYHGVTGGFMGKFAIHEFADMMEKYSNIEARDIFLYHLDFNALQVEMLVEHLVEVLQLATLDYFFFDENCAYQLMAVLDAVRPDLRLVDALNFYVTPMDILKVLGDANLIREVAYEPSIHERLQARLGRMTWGQRRTYQRFLAGTQSVRAVHSVLVADAIIETLNMQIHERHGKKTPRLAQLQMHALVRRAQLGIPQKTAEPLAKTPPHLSHGDQRFAIGLGDSQDGGYMQLTFRPALHDIHNRSQGFQRNSAIVIGEASIRQYQDSHTPTVEQLKMLSVAKLQGHPTEFAYAWRMHLGLEARRPDCLVCLGWNTYADAGLVRSVVPHHVDVFTLMRLIYRPWIRDTAWSGGVGMVLGLTVQPCDQVRLFTVGSVATNPEGVAMRAFDAVLALDINPDVDLRLRYNQLQVGTITPQRNLDVMVGWNF